MTRLWLIVVVMVVGGCGSKSIEGDPDSATDVTSDEEDTDVEVEVPCPDSDGDGYLDQACGGDDCDDEEASVYPGAPEVCGDGIDQDCDGVVDGIEHVTPSLELSDLDFYMDTVVDLAWTGSEAAVGWNDRAEPFTASRAYITRVDSDGLETGDDVLLTHPDSHLWQDAMAHRTAWDGAGYGVVWLGPTLDSSMGLRFGQLDSTGVALSAGRELRQPEEDALFATSTWSGSVHGVTWVEQDSAVEEIHFMTLDSTGEPVGTETVLTDTDMGSHVNPGFDSQGPDTLWTGSEFAVVWVQWDAWGEDSSIHLARLDPWGTPITSDTTLLSRPAAPQVEVAWTGSEYVLAWNEMQEEDPTTPLVVTRVSPEGEVIEEAIPIYDDALA